MYKERDELTRQEFLEALSKIPAEDVVYLDESGSEHQTIQEKHWSPIGHPEIGEKSGGARQRTTFIAAINNDNVLAPFCLKGSTNTEVFIYWLKNFLVPELKRGQVIVMDNASFHKSPQVREIIEEARCWLLYLPPYSPDLNPIEHYWANLKRFIAKIRYKFINFSDAIDYAFSTHKKKLTS